MSNDYCFKLCGKAQYEEALKIYESILREVDSFAEKDMIKAMTLNNMGELYHYKNEHDKSKTIFFKVSNYSRLSI